MVVVEEEEEATVVRMADIVRMVEVDVVAEVEVALEVEERVGLTEVVVEDPVAEEEWGKQTFISRTSSISFTTQSPHVCISVSFREKNNTFR